MLKRLLSQAEQAEVFEISSEATLVGFEANQMRSFEVRETQGIAARVVREGRIGFAATSDLRATDQVVANALESARYGEALPIRFPAALPGPQPQVYDPVLAGLPLERLIEMGREVIEIILPDEPTVTVKIDLERRVRQATVRNSSGAEQTLQKSPLSIELTVQRAQGEELLNIFEYYNTAALDGGHRALARRVVEKLRLARRSATIAPGRWPVLFSPEGALIAALPLAMGLDGRNVLQGISPLGGRVGEQLFDDKLTVLDDPTLDGRPGSASHDDEGVPRRRRALIERGVLQGFIYDLKTAAQAGTVSTGNAERSLFAPPIPNFSNLVLAGGTTPLAEILGGIAEGLWVESALGLGQGNTISGEFSYNLALAYKIERGEIVGRVQDISVAGNIYQDLRRIAAISRESEWVYGGLCLPYLLLAELNVVR